MADRRTTTAIAAVAALLFVCASITGVTSTATGESPEAPSIGKRETVTRVSGSVLVRSVGAASFVPLLGSVSVPDGSEVDASAGRVDVTVARAVAGQTATALVYAGLFAIHQEPTSAGVTTFALTQPLACGRARGRRSSRVATSSRHGRKTQRKRQIWVSEKEGEWGTTGRYVSTTVEGTRWLTSDACTRSSVAVAEGVVQVHDLISNRTAVVTAGHSYVAAEEGSALLPPPGDVLAGVSGGSASAFASQVGKHQAVFGYFGTWGDPLGRALREAHGFHARLLLHLSTDVGYGGGAGEVISPGAIAAGGGDGFLIRAGEELAESDHPAYVALLPEMNQANNAYSAFSTSGAARDGAHSTASFRQAWRRSALIIRGGSVATIDRRLHALGLPPVHTARAALASPRVALMWAPQTAGTPDTPANAPAAYYPGSAYVDIVGTDFYSAFPNFAGLEQLYAHYPSKRFGFNEWGMWQSGDPGFVVRLFDFVRSHSRVGLMVYNQGLDPQGPFRLYRFPAAAQQLRRSLASARFPAFTADAFN